MILGTDENVNGSEYFLNALYILTKVCELFPETKIFKAQVLHIDLKAAVAK